MQTIRTMWKAIFQNKLTIYKANLQSFIQKIIKSRCYVDLSHRLRLKSHPKWERLIKQSSSDGHGLLQNKSYKTNIAPYDIKQKLTLLKSKRLFHKTNKTYLYSWEEFSSRYCCIMWNNKARKSLICHNSPKRG
jgi:hypothetical protein